ncbi:MAG: monooxygenase [Nocardia sp.]|nr:monooxygenase [Nocardia sp.]
MFENVEGSVDQAQRSLTFADPHNEWRDRNELTGGRALLVRPDGHIAARSDEGLAPAMLTALLRRIMGTEAITG